ncbi:MULTISPECIES: hypothetical protein [Maribacter]|uniref:hypothetical protein n=1 Tax=Maribacter TaxID=252356 RepID=UPI0007199873|nr:MULTISPECIES: hypothetical protein [Maribacter]APA65386.1 hypothetical protein YQ22_14325 [Maribacter sp. 1_2014MBL_MicDiv]KSA14425.1 hypothetical protein I600_1019 [Maribacter dokdonensis DSW-8]
MKKYLLLGSLFLLLACDDGDLQIETVDFDSIDEIEFCDEITVNVENVVFKINDDEALILTLASSLIQNSATTTDRESAVPGSSQVTYRIFSETVTSSYFCDSPPPITPTVSEEIEAEGGTIFVTTTTENDTLFTHTIQLSGVTFLNENGSRITDLQINEFGTVTTSIE